MSKRQENRKTAVVDKSVQYTLAGRVILHFFVFICAGTVFGLINQFLMNPFGGVHENVTTFLRQSAPLLLALVCLIPIFIRDTLTLSNRIAGPIYNLRNTIKKISNGDKDVRPLKFRKNDFWSDLPEAFNTMTSHLSRQQADENVEERELVEA